MPRPELFPGLLVTEGGLIPTDRSVPPVPLKHTNVRATVVGPVCAVEVEQQFHNTHSQPVEALYVFPLPENAAVTDFALTLGERTISGLVQEKEAARREYEQAARSGQGAALLEQARPNIFSVAVANIQPDERVQVTLRFHDRLDYDDGSYTFALPTVVMPRYTPPDQQEQAPPASPLLPDGSRDAHTLAVRVEIDAGRLDAITSPSHPIEVEQRRGGRAVVTLKGGESIPNKDFVLRYRVAGSEPHAAAWTYRPVGQPGTLLLTLTPQGLVAPEEVVPRELLFVFDRSGSMGGTAIVQARNALRACLRALNEGDLFNIFPFDHHVEQFATTSQPFTQESIDRADAYIAGIEARGGTEIRGALKFALSQPADPERLRVVVFLTDGGVGNEDEVLRELRGSLGAARVFAFGIGSAVNRFLLNKLAEAGRGSAEYLLPDEEIEEAVQRFQRRAALPLLTDLQIEWGGARVTDALPAPLPDLYAGQPLALLARFHSTGTTTVRLRARGRRGPFEQALEVEWPQETPDRSPLWAALPQVWARARVEHLLNESRHSSDKSSPNRDEILSLGLTYRLLTPYTSFVAVEERRDEHGARTPAERVQVPIHLPAGTLREAFEPPAPVFATMAMHRLSAAPGGAPLAQRARKATGMLGGLGEMLREGIDMLGGTRGGGAAAPAPSMPDAYVAPAPALSAPHAPQQAATQQPTNDGERAQAALRYLARTQSVNGSWGDDLAATALALAAFVAAGHTDSAGSFRPQLARAAQWLAAHGAGSALAGWALGRLAAATGAQGHAAARDRALGSAPSTGMEAAFAALARQEQPDLSTLPGGTVGDTSGVLAALVRALADANAAAATAQQLAPLQSQRDATSGAVVPPSAQQPTIFAATALGALLWRSEAV